MDFKKKMKNFFTLTRNVNGGFTLVELIVVIAILAILAGVGIPVYSGYITKANMQTDMTLISEIEHALTLAVYNGTFADGEGGSIVLGVATPFTSQQAGQGSNLDKALVAAFGENYSLQLKYDGWGNTGHLKYLGKGGAQIINNSSYMNRQERLMKDVEIVTNVVDLLANMNLPDSELETGVTTRKAMIDMFSVTDAEGKVTNSLLDATNDYYGLDLQSPEELYEWSNNKGTDLSNLMVFAAANEMDNKNDAMFTGGNTQLSSAVEYISDFSHFYAYAAQDAEFAKTLDNYLAFLEDPASVELTNYQGEPMRAVEGYGSAAEWYRSLMDEAGNSKGYKAYHEDNLDGTEYKQGSKPAVDQLAFQFMLSSLGNPDEAMSDLVAGNLSDPDLFTDGVGGQMYNDFLIGVDAVLAMGGNVDLSIDAGEVGILYTMNNQMVHVMDTIPQ